MVTAKRIAVLGIVAIVSATSGCGSDEPKAPTTSTWLFHLVDPRTADDPIMEQGSYNTPGEDSCYMKEGVGPVTVTVKDKGGKVVGSGTFPDVGKWLPALDECVTQTDFDILAGPDDYFDVTWKTANGLGYELPDATEDDVLFLQSWELTPQP